jgi:hypothetical protein
MFKSSLRKEMRLLRIYVVGATVFAILALIVGMAGVVHAARNARNANFATLTVHRLVIRDQEGKLAMVLTNHDEPMPSIVAGQKFYRHGGGGTEIIFYNRRGNEQGGFVWNGMYGKHGHYHSSNVMSYDSINTDELLQVHDGNDDGKMFSYITGWNQPNFDKPKYRRLLHKIAGAKSAAKVAAALKDNPVAAEYAHASVRRYLVGYNTDNNSIVMLADAHGHPRIKMFVTPAGHAKLEFLDAHGHVVAHYPH